MANFITGIRIVLSIAILLCPALSSSFYVIYIISGLTDMIDGTVARKTNTASEFGAKLDTIADFTFVMACLIKLLPVMTIPRWLYIWVAVIFLIKVINVISGFASKKEFVAAHTLMNKVTGALLFILPLTLPVIELQYSAVVVCLIASFAAVQEGHYIRTGKV